MSAWIEFVDAGTSASGKTRVWRVLERESRARLGEVTWYAPWRGYAFTVPVGGMVFEQKCLRDIADFCEQMTLDHRAGKR